MVKPGQIVALAGNSGSGGNTTHLHLEVFDVGNTIENIIGKRTYYRSKK